MSILRSNKNKSVSKKLKRSIAFNSWRRNISGKEKLYAEESRKELKNDHMFKEMAEEFIADHNDVLRELANK